MARSSGTRDLLQSFTEYVDRYPDQRFWQALRNWAGINYVFASDIKLGMNLGDLEDTFYWEGKNRREIDNDR